ncbi:unnamed protein product [Tuber aestivum]|uniref:Ribosomal protein L35Ae n=1 Tax=Tuber aestivum TaxID=59557 RepID=A0A292PTZ6_9PEZI|nr:unnamed protein product [Tuber aestivum]
MPESGHRHIPVFRFFRSSHDRFRDFGTSALWWRWGCVLGRATGSIWGNGWEYELLERIRWGGVKAGRVDGGNNFYARHLSYQRGKRNTNPNTSLIKIEGVDSRQDASFYLGKKIAFVYRASREVRGSKIRVIWGKVTRPHGNSGVVRAKFRNNLPPKSFGATLRIMLYPSNI